MYIVLNMLGSIYSAHNYYWEKSFEDFNKAIEHANNKNEEVDDAGIKNNSYFVIPKRELHLYNIR